MKQFGPKAVSGWSRGLRHMGNLVREEADMLSLMSIELLAVFVAAVVYLAFMFTKGWHGQGLMGIAVAGGLVSCLLGFDRLIALKDQEWVSVVLVLAGLLVITVSAIVVTRQSWIRGAGRDKGHV